MTLLRTIGNDVGIHQRLAIYHRKVTNNVKSTDKKGLTEVKPLLRLAVVCLFSWTRANFRFWEEEFDFASRRFRAVAAVY